MTANNRQVLDTNQSVYKNEEKVKAKLTKIQMAELINKIKSKKSASKISEIKPASKRKLTVLIPTEKHNKNNRQLRNQHNDEG